MKFGIVAFSLLLVIGAQPRGIADVQANTPSSFKAQDPGAAQQPPHRVSPAPYLLASDDVIAISVINFANLSLSMVVPPDGNISVPLLDPVSVTGKTTYELAQVLRDRWSKFVINPSVTVALVTKRKEDVLVYGFVGKPGVIDFQPPMRAMEAIAGAGGGLKTGDLSHSLLTRKSGEKLTLDLSHPDAQPGGPGETILQVGDIIYVPENRTQVSILGEVLKPGSQDYRDDMTILDALGLSGGVTDNADLAHASVMHDGVERPVDLDALLRKGDLTLNAKLSAGDRILIPETRYRIYVFGAVNRPGFYIYKPGDRILDALNGTGGPSHEANLGKINVIHVDKAKNTANVEVVDIEKFLKKADLKGNVALVPGDVLYIPDKKQGLGGTGILQVLTGMSLLTNTARILGFGL